MCEHKDDFSHQDAMILPSWHPGTKKVIAVDRCLYPLVAVLNATGYFTVASCCGHGHRPGIISLADGRQLLIVKDLDTAARITADFPSIHGSLEVR